MRLNKALEQFRSRILTLDEKEASAKEKALATVTKFEQLEANLLAKKMGLDKRANKTTVTAGNYQYIN